MKKIDKTALLFEMLLGTDMYNVNRKIEEVKVSKEYVRVSNFVPEISNTQIAYDIKEKFDQLDIFGVLSMRRILEVERQVKELDRRIKKFPSLNPYLANGIEKEYNINTLGDVKVELSSEGIVLDDFVSKEGVRTSYKKKILKTKLFNWYKEAKHSLIDTLDNSKLMLTKIRRSKFNIYSINLECCLLVIASIAFTFLIFGTNFFSDYIAKTIPLWQQITVTCGYYLTLLGTCLSIIVASNYKSYPFYVASDLRKQIIEQGKLVKQLDNKAYDCEKKIISNANKSKLDYGLNSLALQSRRGKLTTSELFDYVYSEKEFYLERKSKLIGFNNAVFAFTIMLSVIAMFLLIVF